MIHQPVQRDFMCINNGKWTEEMVVQVRDLSQWTVKELYLNHNQRPTLVREIAHVHFTSLTWLNLSGNKMESIEGLYRVQMPPHLQSVFMGQQHHFAESDEEGCLACPTTAQYHLQQFWGWEEYGTGCFPQMQQLNMYFTWRGDKNTFIEQCFPAKIQAALQILHIHKNEFCFDRSIGRVLQQRWPAIQIE